MIISLIIVSRNQNYLEKQSKLKTMFSWNNDASINFFPPNFLLFNLKKAPIFMYQRHRKSAPRSELKKRQVSKEILMVALTKNSSFTVAVIFQKGDSYRRKKAQCLKIQ